MNWCLLLAGTLCLALSVLSKPVRRGPPQPHTVEGGSPESRPETGLAYDYYLREVVAALESDPSFRKKLETANISEIKSGSIAMELEKVNHSVRTVLDELKRREIGRLQELNRREKEGIAGQLPRHLDLSNQKSFEVADLRNLILQTTLDLEEMDRRKEEEFKEYEMEKEYEKLKHLNELSEEDKKKEEAKQEELRKKHADHPHVNHPGSKDQFEEVWDKADHLEDQDFDPKTFFFKHDLNGDLEWSIEEVDAVLQLELDKVYDPRNPTEEDDPLEREEEMNRMRKHVFEEMDRNKDYRISLDEFLSYTGTRGDQPQFKEDEGWKTVDEAPVFSEEEFQKFLETHHPQGQDFQKHDLTFESEKKVEHSPPHQQQPLPHDQQQQLPLVQQQPPQDQQQHQQQPLPHDQQQQLPLVQQQPPQDQQQQQPSQSQQPELPHESQPHPSDQREQENVDKLQQQIRELQDKLNQQQHKQDP